MVRYNTLQDDFYYLDEENFRVIGQERGTIFQLGDPVKVRVEAVDLIKKQMDFTLVSRPNKIAHKKKIKKLFQLRFFFVFLWPFMNTGNFIIVSENWDATHKWGGGNTLVFN